MPVDFFKTTQSKVSFSAVFLKKKSRASLNCGKLNCRYCIQPLNLCKKSGSGYNFFIVFPKPDRTVRRYFRHRTVIKLMDKDTILGTQIKGTQPLVAGGPHN